MAESRFSAYPALEQDPEGLLLRSIFGLDAVIKPLDQRTQEEQEQLVLVVEEALKALTYRERETIRLRYAIGDGYAFTLDEVGRIFKATRERFRQIESKAIRKLQGSERVELLRAFVSEDAPSV